MLIKQVMLCGVMLAVSLGVQAQTCHDDIAPSAPDTRFQDLGDGTVVDLSTELVWKRCVEGLSGTYYCGGDAESMSWQEALQYASTHRFASNSQWRLPSKNELASLIEDRCDDPAIHPWFFPNTPTERAYWTSSPDADDADDAWRVDFRHGHIDSDHKRIRYYVRLVRDLEDDDLQ